MGYRDTTFWTEEAIRKMITRRLERYNAALMPHQTPETIRETMAGMANRLAELEHGESEITRVDRENAELIQAAKLRRIHRRGKGPAKNTGKPAFKHVKTQYAGMVRKVK